jgi:hypothetical protein
MILQKKTLEELRNIINEKSEYRSGPKLVTFFNALGSNDMYGQGFPSRWVYTDAKLNHINGTPKLDQCIKNVFAVVNFIGKISSLDALINDFNQYMAFDKWKIKRSNNEILFKKLDKIIVEEPKETPEIKEDDFLKQEFTNLNIDALGLETSISEIVKLRFNEIEICLQNNASLSSIFLIGSTLEGILLGIALLTPQKFNQSTSAPKDKDTNKVKQFHLWTLSNLIDVSSEIGLLKQDVKKFSHILRDFRNYIHPYEQMSSKFNPDKHTAMICWQVLKAVIYQISNTK